MRQRLATVCIILVASTVVGQEQLPSDLDCGCQYRVGVPAVQAIQRYYSALPRNRDEDVAVILYVPTNKCGCCALTNNPNQPGIFPTKFELLMPQGFRLRFKSGFKYKSTKSGNSIELAAGEKIVFLKIRADHDVPLGEYKLHGKLTYQTVQDHKLQPPQELAVVIPVKVVDQNGKTQEVAWPFGTHVKRNIVRIIALPLEIPAALFLAIACSTPKGCDL